MKKLIDCDKCQGTGFIEAFQHIDNGTCYKCKGTGKINEPRKSQPAKKGKYSEEFLKIWNDETKIVENEWKNDPRYPDFIKSQKREGWTGTLLERSWAANFSYKFMNGKKSYEISMERLEEKGILPY
jgi:hypothetical protein